MLARLNADARRLALVGLRRQCPEASEALLLQNLSERLLGEDLRPIDVLLHVTQALEALAWNMRSVDR